MKLQQKKVCSEVSYNYVIQAHLCHQTRATDAARTCHSTRNHSFIAIFNKIVGLVSRNHLSKDTTTTFNDFLACDYEITSANAEFTLLSFPSRKVTAHAKFQN